MVDKTALQFCSHYIVIIAIIWYNVLCASAASGSMYQLQMYIIMDYMEV